MFNTEIVCFHISTGSSQHFLGQGRSATTDYFDLLHSKSNLRYATVHFLHNFYGNYYLCPTYGLPFITHHRLNTPAITSSTGDVATCHRHGSNTPTMAIRIGAETASNLTNKQATTLPSRTSKRRYRAVVYLSRPTCTIVKLAVVREHQSWTMLSSFRQWSTRPFLAITCQETIWAPF